MCEHLLGVGKILGSIPSTENTTPDTPMNGSLHVQQDSSRTFSKSPKRLSPCSFGTNILGLLSSVHCIDTESVDIFLNLIVIIYVCVCVRVCELRVGAHKDQQGALEPIKIVLYIVF